jgi:hypothetical protein
MTRGQRIELTEQGQLRLEAGAVFREHGLQVWRHQMKFGGLKTSGYRATLTPAGCDGGTAAASRSVPPLRRTRSLTVITASTAMTASCPG